MVNPLLPAAVLAAVLLAPPASPGLCAPAPWRPLQPGVDYRLMALPSVGGYPGAELHVVRLTPAPGRLRFILAGDRAGEARTPGAWCRTEHLAVAVNLGMFRRDNPLGHVGYLRSDGQVRSPSWNAYRSLLVLGARQAGFPEAGLLDLESSRDGEAASRPWRSAAQNLRLIAEGPGGPHGVWSPRRERWSEAALAQDGGGRLLILYCRQPLAMDDFIRLLLASDLDVRRAMHLEGGPYAGLSIHAAGIDLDLGGSLEGESPAEGTGVQWPVPNILAVPAP